MNPERRSEQIAYARPDSGASIETEYEGTIETVSDVTRQSSSAALDDSEEYPKSTVLEAVIQNRDIFGGDNSTFEIACCLAKASDNSKVFTVDEIAKELREFLLPYGHESLHISIIHKALAKLRRQIRNTGFNVRKQNILSGTIAPGMRMSLWGYRLTKGILIKDFVEQTDKPAVPRLKSPKQTHYSSQNITERLFTDKSAFRFAIQCVISELRNEDGTMSRQNFENLLSIIRGLKVASHLNTSLERVIDICDTIIKRSGDTIRAVHVAQIYNSMW